MKYIYIVYHSLVKAASILVISQKVLRDPSLVKISPELLALSWVQRKVRSRSLEILRTRPVRWGQSLWSPPSCSPWPGAVFSPPCWPASPSWSPDLSSSCKNIILIDQSQDSLSHSTCAGQWEDSKHCPCPLCPLLFCPWWWRRSSGSVTSVSHQKWELLYKIQTGFGLRKNPSVKNVIKCLHQNLNILVGTLIRPGHTVSVSRQRLGQTPVTIIPCVCCIVQLTTDYNPVPPTYYLLQTTVRPPPVRPHQQTGEMGVDWPD